MSYDDGIFWVKGNTKEPDPGVALVLRPGSYGSLERELRQMKQAGIDVLVSMQELDEAEDFGLAQEGPLAEKAGMRFFSFPIPDHHVPPDRDKFQELISELEALSREGHRIGIHCQGSIGRATVTASSLLVHLGWEPQAALEAIETARGCEVPDTEEQRAWILRYKARA